MGTISRYIVRQKLSKGQIISEQNCGVLNFPKKQLIVRISALATKMGQIRKKNAHYHAN